MKPSEALCASSDSEKGVVCLQGKGFNYIIVCGSSLPISAKPGDEFVNLLTIAPPRGEVGIVALTVCVCTRFEEKKGVKGVKTYSCQSYLLEVGYGATGPWVNLERPWISSFDRLGQVYRNHIEVQVGEVIYTSLADEHYYISRQVNYRYVPNANLLCQYLIGKVDPEELEAAAVEQKVEQKQERSAKEQLAEVKNQLTEVQTELAETIESQKTLVRTYGESIEDMTRALKSCQGIAMALYLAATEQKWKSRALKKAIAEYNAYIEGEKE